MTSIIKNLILLALAAAVGYVLWKIWQAFAPVISTAGKAASATAGVVTSVQDDLKAAWNAVGNFDPVASLFPNVPAPVSAPYADLLNNPTANLVTDQGPSQAIATYQPATNPPDWFGVNKVNTEAQDGIFGNIVWAQ